MKWDIPIKALADIAEHLADMSQTTPGWNHYAV